jgi:hypothetical protein
MAKSNKAQKKKHQKKVARRKKLEKDRNQRANKSMRRYRLDVKHQGNWKTYKFFKTEKQVNKHLADTEKKRREGTEIIEGRVIDLNTDTQVAHVKPSGGLGISMFDAAKDLSVNEEKSKINQEKFDKELETE